MEGKGKPERKPAAGRGANGKGGRKSKGKGKTGEPMTITIPPEIADILRQVTAMMGPISSRNVRPQSNSNNRNDKNDKRNSKKKKQKPKQNKGKKHQARKEVDVKDDEVNQEINNLQAVEAADDGAQELPTPAANTPQALVEAFLPMVTAGLSQEVDVEQMKNFFSGAVASLADPSNPPGWIKEVLKKSDLSKAFMGNENYGRETPADSDEMDEGLDADKAKDDLDQEVEKLKREETMEKKKIREARLRKIKANQDRKQARQKQHQQRRSQKANQRNQCRENQRQRQGHGHGRRQGNVAHGGRRSKKVNIGPFELEMFVTTKDVDKGVQEKQPREEEPVVEQQPKKKKEEDIEAEDEGKDENRNDPGVAALIALQSWIQKQLDKKNKE